MADLPQPIDGTQVYLAAIHTRLGDILDRLPAPAPTAEPGEPVELREPDPPAAERTTRPAPRKRTTTTKKIREA